MIFRSKHAAAERPLLGDPRGDLLHLLLDFSKLVFEVLRELVGPLQLSEPFFGVVPIGEDFLRRGAVLFTELLQIVESGLDFVQQLGRIFHADIAFAADRLGDVLDAVAKVRQRFRKNAGIGKHTVQLIDSLGSFFDEIAGGKAFFVPVERAVNELGMLCDLFGVLKLCTLGLQLFFLALARFYRVDIADLVFQKLDGPCLLLLVPHDCGKAALCFGGGMV